MRTVTFFRDYHDRSMQRIGFFTKCEVKAGEEMTFNYGFEPQPGSKCFCNTESCFAKKPVVGAEGDAGVGSPPMNVLSRFAKRVAF